MIEVSVNTDECLTWAGNITPLGYGRLYWRDNGKQVNMYAHRLMYELEVGAIPDGLVLDHLCRNRSCINVQHLEPVTNRENIKRGIGPPYMGRTHCLKGHLYTKETEQSLGNERRRCRICRKEYMRVYMKAWNARHR